MEKRRIRLEINGVVCGLITEESEEYMQSLATEVGDLMRAVQEASPYITREAAALTAALSYCDDAKKNAKEAEELRDRVDELEIEAEIWQEDKADMLQKAGAASEKDARENLRLSELESETAALREKLSTQESEAAALREKVSGQESEAAALREKLSTQESEAAALREKLSGQESETAALREKLSGQESENARLRERIEELTAQAAPAEGTPAEGTPAESTLAESTLAESTPAKSAPAENAARPAGGSTEEHKPVTRRNPLRHYEEDAEGVLSFFEKK